MLASASHLFPLNWRYGFATRYDCVKPRRLWQIEGSSKPKLFNTHDGNVSAVMHGLDA